MENRCGKTMGHGDFCTGDPNDPYLCGECKLRNILRACMSAWIKAEGVLLPDEWHKAAKMTREDVESGSYDNGI